VRRHTKFLDYSARRRVRAGHDFDLADLKRDPKGETAWQDAHRSRTQGEVGPEQAQSGLSGRKTSMELHDLLTPDEISRHFSRSVRLKRQLVIWGGYDPMILAARRVFRRERGASSHVQGNV
jgi:hypothetical protein